ncbi:hypothetical protein RvY_03348 [Ramazzottius varieornatus]|uniref:Uncharacterized protein n=1 Tax=Ramazzottius varieornatus TaxID=947166 RepID=A0A1D1UR47_RAMVA|nr:hypothetical protein RvY_03348 [Ramazzottius varieornatus]
MEGAPLSPITLLYTVPRNIISFSTAPQLHSNMSTTYSRLNADIATLQSAPRPMLPFQPLQSIDRNIMLTVGQTSQPTRSCPGAAPPPEGGQEEAD